MKRWLYVLLFASLAVNVFVAGAIATHFIWRGDHGHRARGPLNMRAAMMALKPEDRQKVRAVWRANRDGFRAQIREIRKARRALRQMVENDGADEAKVQAALKEIFDKREALRARLFDILGKMAAALPEGERMKFYRAALKRRKWRRGHRRDMKEKREER